MKKHRSVIPGPAGCSQFSQRFSSAEHEATIKSPSQSSIPIQSWDTITEIIFGARDKSSGEPELLLANIADVHNGLHDLRISHIVIIIEEITKSIDGSYSLKLKDPTGEILGFISKSQWVAIQKLACGTPLQKGSALYLQQSPIFVQKYPFARFLSVHSSNIRFILPPQPRQDT